MLGLFGAVLTQNHDDELQPVAWAGRKMSKAEVNITYIPGDKNVVTDAVSRATHLPMSQVVLHGGHPLAAETPHESYPALSLISSLVRRDHALPYETTSYASPTLVVGSEGPSHGSTSAPSMAARNCHGGSSYAQMLGNSNSTLPNRRSPISFPELLTRRPAQQPRPQPLSVAATQP